MGFLAPVSQGLACGLSSTGNVDGCLTWRLGDIEAGQSARTVVLFGFENSHAKLTELLAQARRQFATPPEPPAAGGPNPPATVWLRNAATDFALQAPGCFFWEGGKQSLAFSGGGQLSRFGYYLHYHDGAPRRAGTPITDRNSLENLRVMEPVRAVGGSQAVARLETTDQKLRLRVRAILGEGTVTAVEFQIVNQGAAALRDVRLTAYANLEAAHDYENDFSTLDSRAAALLVVDPRTEMCLAMAGINPPASGFSGVWPSREQLQTAAGIPLDQWKAFAGIPAEMKKGLLKNPQTLGVYDSYAPAPAVKPIESETRNLTTAEADAALQRDWLFQAEGKPLAERARLEIRWARELAARLTKGGNTPDLKAEVAELDKLEKQLLRFGVQVSASSPSPAHAARSTQQAENQSLLTPAATEIYLAVRAVKRRIQFKNPVVDFSQVLFIDNPYPQGREWQHQVRHRNGMMAVPGGRLLVLDGLSPGGKLRKLAPDKPGFFWKPDLSFDGQRVVFCLKKHDEKSFHLYEINLDGSGLRQITDGPYDDLDPIYLPDGKIAFSTTRANTYIRCMPYTYSYVLARCDADGRNLYFISHASEPEWTPTLLNDGRVIFSRWEYIDKALWRIQSLWTVRQDGTAAEAFWGNQSVWPDHQAEPRPIPNSQRVMFTGLAHHDWFAGSIGIIDPAKGKNFPHGLTKVTADVAWPECGTPPSDPVEAADYHTAGGYDAYKSPYPLSEEDFLVSARHDGKFRLYLMDVRGNRELISEGAHHLWHALPVKPRVAPPQHADVVAWPGTGKDRQPPQPGIFYSANVCQGVPELSPRQVKYLRVLQMDHKTYSLWSRDARHSGPAISPLQDDGVKRILGTVPVEPDGSVHFKVPPGVVLYFQLLDEHQRALQTMRSSTGVMPGERRSCVGCHEQHSTAPANATGLALRHGPSELAPPPWGTGSISYERMVQPVLDRYCGKCHQGEADGRKKLDLTLRPGQGVFKEPYLTLVGPIGYGLNKQPHSSGLAGALMCENFEQSDPDSYATLPPLRALSYTSKLIELCRSGRHYEVTLDDASLQMLIGWVDANCPYRGEEDVRDIPDPVFAGVENLPVRPRTRTAPNILRP